MATDLNASFNEQFMSINTKLKKRFMRKPNITEAANEFIGLAIQCEHSEQPTFAGHSYIGAAKCEASAGNFLGEAEHYLAAARQFMKAEKKLTSLKFHSIDRENLEAAIGCYLQALHKYPEGSLLRPSILLELVEGLITLNLKFEAITYLRQALNMIEEKIMKIIHTRNLMNLLIDCEKFDAALDSANQLIDTYDNIPEDILAEVQVSRILLTLLVDPAEDAKPVSLKQLFSDLMNDRDSEAIPLGSDLQLKLQSIIITFSTTDVTSLVSVAADCGQHLNIQQKELLEKLVRADR